MFLCCFVVVVDVVDIVVGILIYSYSYCGQRQLLEADNVVVVVVVIIVIVAVVIIVIVIIIIIVI